jgi:hypothetical protein
MEKMPSLRDQVGHYISRLTGPSAEDAWHSLVEVGPRALPLLVEAFHESSDLGRRCALIDVAAQYRVDDAVPFFAGCLDSVDPMLWRAALDGLVTVGSRRALESLTLARQVVSSERSEWIDEAIEQVQEGGTPV